MLMTLSVASTYMRMLQQDDFEVMNDLEDVDLEDI